jgi:hypothetical protein
MPRSREAWDIIPVLQQRFHNIPSGYCVNYWHTPYYYIVSFLIYIFLLYVPPIY